jgi:two-component system chemotaxis response regulator CheY
MRDKMRVLIVEDELTSRIVLQEMLQEILPYANCYSAINGGEAIKAFSLAWEEKNPFVLICLDIKMPEMDGQEVLKEIRELEAEKGIGGLSGVKIIMTTVLGDHKNIIKAFREQCEAYIVKPIKKKELIEQIKSLGLLEQETGR